MKHLSRPAYLLFAAFLTLLVSPLLAQKQQASPFKTTSAEINEKTVTIAYCAPYKKGRDIFGALVPYDKVWRTGANEATTLEISDKVSIQGKTLEAGKYSLFTIPNKDEWTIIINADPKQWGAYSYKADKDVMRFKVKPNTVGEVEQFSILVSEDGKVSLTWDTTQVVFNIE